MPYDMPHMICCTICHTCSLASHGANYIESVRNGRKFECLLNATNKVYYKPYIPNVHCQKLNP